jgi:hypothetical protein
MKFGHERFLLAERAGHFKILVLDGFCDGIQSQSAQFRTFPQMTPPNIQEAFLLQAEGKRDNYRKQVSAH